MTDLSSGNLYQPLLLGNGLIQRLDNYMWPTFRRVTDEKGGDLYCDFQIDTVGHNVDPATLERWFIEWIGCHFEETFAGLSMFHGRVHTLRLYIGGVMLVHSLENMFNSVQVSYQPDSVSASNVTSAATDADSIALYGTRQFIFEPSSYLTQTHAEAKRDEFLSRHKQPFIESGDVTPRDDGGAMLEVYIQGYGTTLDDIFWNQSSESASSGTLSSHITTDLITGLDYVSTGTIETVSTTITSEADYITILRRIDDLLADSPYSYGCFAGRSFDLTARDETNIKYTRRAYGRRGGIWRLGRLVPDPMVRPGGIIWTEDIYAGRPIASTLLDDVRASWVAQVEYSLAGIRLRNGEQPDSNWNAANQAVVMAAYLKETSKKEPNDVTTASF